MTLLYRWLHVGLIQGMVVPPPSPMHRLLIIMPTASNYQLRMWAGSVWPLFLFSISYMKHVQLLTKFGTESILGMVSLNYEVIVIVLNLFGVFSAPAIYLIQDYLNVIFKKSLFWYFTGQVCPRWLSGWEGNWLWLSVLDCEQIFCFRHFVLFVS